VMLPLCQHLYGDPHFHEIFAAAERQGLVIAMHNCGATLTTHGYFNYFIEWHTAICQSWMSQIISMIANGVFERFPTLKAVMAESGFTWVPHLMSRFDQQWRELRREVRGSPARRATTSVSGSGSRRSRSRRCPSSASCS
jgi:predicted TIM-barrel fold metal-dependent hydrolase